MTTHMMEEYVAQLYPTKEWQSRVRRMPIEQVVAIYYSSIERKRKRAEEERQRRLNDRYFHQMTLEEYFSKGETV